MVIIVNKFCCGFTLRTGSTVIGYLCVLGSIGGLSSNIKNATQKEIILPDGFDNDILELLNYLIRVQCYMAVILIPVYIVSFCVSIMLLYGINMNDPKLIKPWILYSIFNIALSVVIYFIWSIIVFQYGVALDGFIVMACFGSACSLAAYFIIVVNSHYLELLNNGFYNQGNEP